MGQRPGGATGWNRKAESAAGGPGQTHSAPNEQKPQGVSFPPVALNLFHTRAPAARWEGHSSDDAEAENPALSTTLQPPLQLASGPSLITSVPLKPRMEPSGSGQGGAGVRGGGSPSRPVQHLSVVNPEGCRASSVGSLQRNSAMLRIRSQKSAHGAK